MKLFTLPDGASSRGDRTQALTLIFTDPTALRVGFGRRIKAAPRSSVKAGERFTVLATPRPRYGMLLFDELTDIDGTALEDHTIFPWNTPHTRWSALEQHFEISGNQARNVEGGICSAVWDFGVADAVYTGTSRITFGADFALLFRARDANNYWLAVVQLAGQFALLEKNNGTYVERDATSFVVVGFKDYDLRVTLDEDSITATLDGEHEITYTSSFLQTATQYGIWCAAQSARSVYFDDLMVAPFQSPPEGNLLLETGDALLLETGDHLLLN